MNTTKDGDSIDISSAASEMGSEFRNALGSMDTLAAQRLQSLHLVQQGRLSQLSRSLAEIKTQYPPDSQEVKSAEAAVAATSTTVGRVSMAHQQLTTLDPQVAQDGWALHGRVFDAQLKPVSGFTVFLVDGQKTYQQAFGFSYTDDTGYFLINYGEPQTTVAGQAGRTPPTTRPSAKTSPKAAAEPPMQSASAPQLFLEIANTKAQPVYLSESLFTPVIGSPTYENVVLPPGNPPIGDPPQEVRDIALPKGRKRPASSRARK